MRKFYIWKQTNYVFSMIMKLNQKLSV